MNLEEKKVLDDTASALLQVLNTTKDGMEKIMMVCKHLSQRVERLECLTGHEYPSNSATPYPTEANPLFNDGGQDE